ncbi:MAG: hypothetical protein QW242_02075 [Desulfurococcaceae archaeon]
MWFTLSILLIALLQVLDLVSIILAVNFLFFSPVEVGLVSALWTLSFIMGSRVYGRSSDKGLFKGTLSFSTIFILLYSALISICLKTESKTLFTIAYAIHAQAYASARVTIMTLILEYYDYYNWRNVNLRYSSGVYFVDGLTLFILSLFGFRRIISNILVFTAILLITSILLLSTLPNLNLLIERNLFRLDRVLNKSLMNIKNVVFTIPIVDYKGRFFQSETVGFGSILSGIAGFIYSSEVFFTILPFIFIRTCGLSIDTVLLIYGFGKFVSSILVSIAFRTVSKAGLGIIILIRSLAFITIFLYPHNIFTVTLSLITIYVSGLTINAALYNLYNEATYGYGVYRYTIFCETISFIGSLTSGFLYRAFGLYLIPIAIMIKLMLLSRVMLSRQYGS